MSDNAPSPPDVDSASEAASEIESPDIAMTADALVAAARLLLVPRTRLKNIALSQEVLVAALTDLVAPGREDSLSVLRRVCGPAVLCLREALRLDPSHAEAHSLLATAYGDLGHGKAAIAHRRQALALEPANQEERDALVLALLEERRREGARAGAA